MEYHLKTISKKSDELRNCRTIDEIDSKFRYHIGNPEILAMGEQTISVRFRSGGLALNLLDYTHIDPWRFLQGLEDIFYGVHDMNSRGYYHLDIKTTNITMDAEYRFKLIDFELSGKKDRSDIFLNIYAVWPFETRLLARHEESDVGKTMSDEVLGAYISDVYTKRFLKGRDTSLIKSNYIKLKSLPREGQCRLIFPKIDVYSLGIALQCLLQSLVNLPSFIVQELAALVVQMTHFDTELRLTPTESWARYKEILTRCPDRKKA